MRFFFLPTYIAALLMAESGLLAAKQRDFGRNEGSVEARCHILGLLRRAARTISGP